MKLQLVTADEAAGILRMSRPALYAAVRRGQIPAHRLGRRRLRFFVDELETLVNEGRRPRQGATPKGDDDVPVDPEEG